MEIDNKIQSKIHSKGGGRIERGWKITKCDSESYWSTSNQIIINESQIERESFNI